MPRSALPLLLAAALSGCVFIVDAGSDGDVGKTLTVWRQPGFSDLAQDLEHAGWDVDEIDYEDGVWHYEIETLDGHLEAEMHVRFDDAHGYTIDELEIEGRIGAQHDRAASELQQLAERSRER